MDTPSKAPHVPSRRELEELYIRAEAVWLKRVVTIGENDRTNGDGGKVAAEVLVLLRQARTGER